MLSGQYDLIVLDEINYAVSFTLIEAEDLLKLLDERPAEVELILTGRNAHPDVIERADLVTEMNPVKHPFERGVSARKGLEF